MYRLLIADPSVIFGEGITNALKGEMCTALCHDAKQTLKLIREFDPDILLLDAMLPGGSSLTVLQALRTSGRNTKVIVMSRIINETVISQLSRYNICALLQKPCTLGLTVCNIHDAAFLLDHPDLDTWCLENETDLILQTLGFRMGPKRYGCVFEGVLARYRDPECSMKSIYIDVANRCGSEFTRVEKAIRDAVEDAYECGDKELWALYFPPNEKRDKPYPNNEDFIARIAGCLVQHTRIKKPWTLMLQKAE